MEVIIYSAFLVTAFISGFLYGNSHRNKSKSYSISNEQLNDWIKQYYNDKDYSKLDFTEFVTDYLAGKIQPKEMSSSGTVEVTELCKGPDCPCYPTREDSCTCMTDDGRCCNTINLNVLCGIHDCVEEIKSRGKLLSKEEIKELTEALQNFSVK